MHSKMKKKYIYDFNAIDCSHKEAKQFDKHVLGNKGACLAQMIALGIPVPPGFTISTSACLDFYTNGIDSNIKDQVTDSLKKIERISGRKFGSKTNPLILSIRSGAAVSMPGMMDTILNIGINDKVVEAFSDDVQNLRFVLDSYRRLMQMYGSVVHQIDLSAFEYILETRLRISDVQEKELSIEDLQFIIDGYKALIMEKTGVPFTQNVYDQLWDVIKAVFNSWHNERAAYYRSMYNISDSLGTAVNVQMMVFGNMSDDSATGVCFSRNPSNGDKEFFGEYLQNAQGEDVVSGTRDPAPLNTASKLHNNDIGQLSLEELMPDAYQKLESIYKKLEAHYKDMQDIEFTIENKKLYILQTRSGKRTARAAVKIAYDMFCEGLVTKEEALCRIDTESLSQLMHPTIDKSIKSNVVLRGLPASPGAAHGKICLDCAKAEELSKKDQKVILVRRETNPDDVRGISISEAILTLCGGVTSHAAVVARGMGKPCIVGASEASIDLEARTITLDSGLVMKEGQTITINGEDGQVMLGNVPTIASKISDEFKAILSWADQLRSLGVRANADTPEDARNALNFAAEGIGLCRTEHMFFDKDRILDMQCMILAQNKEKQAEFLSVLLSYQANDFAQIFKVMDGKPVNIRLLDPPLHEFLPFSDEQLSKVAKRINMTPVSCKDRVARLKEQNPMLGHRGCRVGINTPAIYEMQIKAIFQAAMSIDTSSNIEIMIPFISSEKEMKIIRGMVEKIAIKTLGQNQTKVQYKIGAMIELPAAALRASKIAEFADFLSFGTNDLTQTTLGISRDDCSALISNYKTLGIYSEDPFVTIDLKTVGQMMKIAINQVRGTHPHVTLSVCGEHAGDAKSINFFHSLGLNYISCSPFRVPYARISSAIACASLTNTSNVANADSGTGALAETGIKVAI